MTIASTLRFLGLGAALAASGWTGAAQAAVGPISPLGYDTTNGASGYYDSIYSGLGDVGASDSVLTGGIGELADGRIPTLGYGDDSGYVGWFSNDPTISFDFGGAIKLTSVTIHYDKLAGSGVYAPDAFSVGLVGGATFTEVVIDALPDGTASATLTLATDLVGQYFDLAITQGQTGSSWIMLSEVSFVGVDVPLPAGLPMLVMGLGAFGLMTRRRKTA